MSTFVLRRDLRHLIGTVREFVVHAVEPAAAELDRQLNLEDWFSLFEWRCGLLEWSGRELSQPWLL